MGCAFGVLAMVPAWWRQRRQAQRKQAAAPMPPAPAPSPAPDTLNSSLPDGF